MKRILLISLLFLLPINANAKVFELSKCYIYQNVAHSGYSSFKDMKSKIYMPKDKKDYPNDAVLDVIFRINTKTGFIKEIWLYSDEFAAKQVFRKKNPQYGLPDNDANEYDEKIDTYTYKMNNYFSGIIEAYMPKDPDFKIRIDINKSEISSRGFFGTKIYRCENGGKRKSHYLDYWWAVILIIAITFFIFTQSGQRLKKIRRK